MNTSSRRVYLEIEWVTVMNVIHFISMQGTSEFDKNVEMSIN